MANHRPDKQHRFFDVTDVERNLKTRTIRGGKITLTSQVLIQLCQLAATMVLARILSPREYGLIAMITVVTNFLSMFKEMGLSSATVQQKEISHKQISALFWVNAILSFATAMVIVAVAPILAWINREPQLLWITIALALEPLFAGIVTQHAALLQRQMYFGRLAIADIVGLLIAAAIGIFTASQGAGVWALVYMLLTRQAVRAVFILAFCPWLPGLYLRRTKIGHMIRFGSNILGVDFVNTIASRLDTFLVGVFCGASMVGIYTRAYQLLLLPLGQISIPFGRVAIPSLSRIITQSEKYRKGFSAILNKITLLGTPPIGLIIATADWIIAVTLGPGWEQAATVFSILGLAGIPTLIMHPTVWLCISQNRTKDLLRCTIGCSIVRLICLIIGLHWGIKGVAVSVVVSSYILLPPSLAFLCRTGPIKAKYFLNSIIKALIFTIITYTAITVFRQVSLISHSLLGLACSILITAILMAIFHCLSPTTQADHQNIQNIDNKNNP